MNWHTSFLAALLGGMLSVSSLANDVIGWRGDGTGAFSAAKPPVSWSAEKNIVWKTPMPSRSYASPVSNRTRDRLFLTAEPSVVMCVDSQSGKILWQEKAGYLEALGEAEAAKIMETHKEHEQERRDLNQKIKDLEKADADDPKLEPLKEQRKQMDTRHREYAHKFPKERGGGAGNSAATPILFEGKLHVTFGTGVVAAFSENGKRLWIKHVEGCTLGFGHSASPAWADGKLIVHFQDLVALNPENGKEVWRTKVPAKHGSPVVATIAGEDVVITPSGAFVKAANGEILKDKVFNLSENSPLVSEGVVYAHESGKIRAFKLPASLEAPLDVEQLWETSSARDQRMASAVIHEGRLYSATRRGLMDVTDAKTGKILYRKRLEIGEMFSSLTAAGGNIYFGGRDGKTLVIKSSEDYDEIGTNQTERYSSNPVFVGQRIYLRGDKHLYCIGQ